MNDLSVRLPDNDEVLNRVDFDPFIDLFILKASPC
jgi:hypothetical protein